MTIMSLVPGTGDDLPSRQISRRIRGLMAEVRISGAKMAEAIGMSQRAFARRYSDEVDWTVDELHLVARAFGISFADLCAVVQVPPADPSGPSEVTEPYLRSVGDVRRVHLTPLLQVVRDAS